MQTLPSLNIKYHGIRSHRGSLQVTVAGNCANHQQSTDLGNAHRRILPVAKPDTELSFLPIVQQPAAKHWSHCRAFADGSIDSSQ